MNKRKLMLVAVALCMVAILGFGGTLAYLTDTETATNVFTTGNVDIKLIEVFDEENAKLLPGIDVEKKITVKNVGSEAAFVRVHVAFPSLLDSGDPDYASYANTLHWNFSAASVANGKWNWNTADIGTHSTMPGWPGNANDYGEWNTYQATVDGVEYTVYVATFETALASGATTDVEAIYKVYLDASLDNVHIEEITKKLTTEKNPNGSIKILVAAEAVQAAGFDGDAYAAFEAAHKDANPSDGKTIVNLPENLIEHVYGTDVEANISTETNTNDQE